MLKLMVLNGEGRASLAIIRALSKEFYCIVGGDNVMSRSFYSKYAKRRFVYPKVLKNPEAANKCILKNVQKFNPDVVMPIMNDTSYLIIKNRDSYLKHTRLIPLPSLEDFIKINNKRSLMQLAKDKNIPIPKSFFPKSFNTLKKISNKIKYPAVIKPIVGFGSKNVKVVNSHKELIKVYKETFLMKQSPDLFEPKNVMIQEFVNGHLLIDDILFKNGKKICRVVQEELYSMPPSAPFAKITILNKQVERMTERVFKGLKWNGVADVQYIVDDTTKKVKLLEINPRLWGSLENSIKAGVNFPQILCDLAFEKPVEPLDSYELGLKFRWLLFKDLLYPLKSKNKIRALKQLCNYDNKTFFEFNPYDIKPHVIQFINLFFGQTG